MASYQQPNDYQTFQTNPYQLPTQQIIGAIQQRNAYWDSGASALKNAYQNYLNLDLTRADNHDKLNQLMNGVNDNLKKASQTDLSLGENYGKALDIFNPIVKDDNIMGDNAITKFYKDQFNTGQSFRIKDNGKEYSETNMRDLSNHLQDFANDPNAANWRQHYSSRVFYTPYTDVSAEVRQVAKDFKPDTKSLTTPLYLDPKTGAPTTDGKGGVPSGRMLNESDKSIIASQYRAFMDAHLSDKAKGQLALDGRVKYHDNIGALAQDYSAYNQDKIDHTKLQIEKLKGSMAGSNATPAEKEIATDSINRYEAQIKDLTIENTKMKAGDYSNLTPYKDNIAGSIHTNNYLDYLSRASAQRNINVSYSPDKTWESMYKESNENERFNIAKNVQLQIAEEKNRTTLTIHGMLGKNGQPLGGPQTYNTADTSNNKQFGIDEFNKLKDNSQKEFQASVDEVNLKIKSDTGMDMNDTTIPQERRDAARQQWFAKNDYDVKKYNLAAQKKSVDDMTFSAIDDFVNNKIQKENPDVYNSREKIINNITKGENITALQKTSNYTSALDNNSRNPRIPLNLSAQDIQKIIRGTHPNIKLDTEEETVGPSGAYGTPSTSQVPVLKMNGKSYYLPTDTILSKSLYQVGQADKDYQDKRSDILNQKITDIQGIKNLFQNDKNPYYNAAHNIVLNKISGGDSGVITEGDVRLTKLDRDGGIYFKVQGDAKIKSKEVKTKVEAADGKYVSADDEYYLPGKYFGDITKQNNFADPRLESLQRLVDFRSNATPNDRFNTPATTWGTRNFTFKVDVQNGHSSYRIVDPYSGAIFGDSKEGIPFETLEGAAAQATQLGNLSNEQYLNFVRTIGKVPDYKP